MIVDDFQMSVKRPTSRGRMRNQEAAVQWTFTLRKQLLKNLSTLMVGTQRSAY